MPGQRAALFIVPASQPAALVTFLQRCKGLLRQKLDSPRPQNRLQQANA
jgi:hypothetical protein